MQEEEEEEEHQEEQGEEEGDASAADVVVVSIYEHAELEKHADVFPPTSSQLVLVGEQTGNMSRATKGVRDHLRRRLPESCWRQCRPPKGARRHVRRRAWAARTWPAPR